MKRGKLIVSVDFWMSPKIVTSSIQATGRPFGDPRHTPRESLGTLMLYRHLRRCGRPRAGRGEAAGVRRGAHAEDRERQHQLPLHHDGRQGPSADCPAWGGDLGDLGP